jgi:hypothetical protein
VLPHIAGSLFCFSFLPGAALASLVPPRGRASSRKDLAAPGMEFLKFPDELETGAVLGAFLRRERASVFLISLA